MVRSGGLALRVALAIVAGERDPVKLTSMLFHIRHPERRGARIRPDEKNLAQEWRDIRDGIVKPALEALSGSPTPSQSALSRAPGVSEQPTDWTIVPPKNRMQYVMKRLVNKYQYPVNGAAGLVGNLWAESAVLPNRIEGSKAASPMLAPDFNGRMREWTAEEVRDRVKDRTGPRLAGVGLAQWTTSDRRRGLFGHTYQGRILGAGIMFNMDAQIDYLVGELGSRYSRVDRVLRGSGVTVNDACDEVLYNFEVPGSILYPKVQGTSRRKRPRNDPAVLAKFEERRGHARTALIAYGPQVRSERIA
jgi:hypothetical protein